jgi:hypothetical protein
VQCESSGIYKGVSLTHLQCTRLSESTEEHGTKLAIRNKLDSVTASYPAMYLRTHSAPVSHKRCRKKSIFSAFLSPRFLDWNTYDSCLHLQKKVIFFLLSPYSHFSLFIFIHYPDSVYRSCVQVLTPALSRFRRRTYHTSATSYIYKIAKTQKKRQRLTQAPCGDIAVSTPRDEILRKSRQGHKYSSLKTDRGIVLYIAGE